jgi:protocatechuate 3,4-dioxygenase beta subunit
VCATDDPAASAAIVAASARAALAPTPEQTLGPFYPRVLPEDRDNDLVQIRGRDKKAQGTVLHLTGRVTDGSAQPVADALVEIWQCDVYGRYLRPADDSPGQRDDNFQGYGEARTDASGNYEFRTIRPVAYAGRPPHIHFQVSHPRYRKLVTQLYAQGDPHAGPRRWAESAYSSLWVSFTPASKEPGALATRFDIVLVAAG